MKNPLKNHSPLLLTAFAIMMTYLLSATVVFGAEVYFQFTQNHSVLPTSWFFKFVHRWHWAILIVFFAYTLLSYFFTKYAFYKLLQKYKEEPKYDSIKQIKKPRIYNTPK